MVLRLIAGTGCDTLLLNPKSENSFFFFPFPNNLNFRANNDNFCFKVHIKAPFILNGVCVLWQGWIHLQTLEGIGCIQFDAEAAKIEDSIMKKQVQLYNQCFTKLL